MSLPGLSRKNGVSLIEVVVGIALMGALAATAIIAGSSHLRQLKVAEKKRLAVDVVDRFLASWSRYDFKEKQAPQAAIDAGVHLRDQASPPIQADFGSSTPQTTKFTIEVVSIHDVPSLKGRVYAVQAKESTSSAVMAKAEIVVGDD